MKKYWLFILCFSFALKLFPQDSIQAITKYNMDSLFQAMQVEAIQRATEERATILKKLATAHSDSIFILRIETSILKNFLIFHALKISSQLMPRKTCSNQLKNQHSAATA